MVVLGLIFVVLAIACGVGLLLGNGTSVSPEWYGLTLDGFSVLSVYVAGLVTMLVLLLGVWLMRRGVRRTVQARRTRGGSAPARPGPVSAGGDDPAEDAAPQPRA